MEKANFPTFDLGSFNRTFMELKSRRIIPAGTF